MLVLIQHLMSFGLTSTTHNGSCIQGSNDVLAPSPNLLHLSARRLAYDTKMLKQRCLRSSCSRAIELTLARQAL